MEKVRIGMIGCGGFMRYRVKQLQEVAEAQIVALADPDPVQIQRTQDAYPNLVACPVFSDYRDMIASTPLDAVFIATPHTQHVDQILDSFEKGLHVLVEKPLVTTVADAQRVIAARDKSGKLAMVSYQRHLQPEFRIIREKVLSKEFGEVRVVSALLCQEWKQFTMGTWRQEPSLSGGGMLLDSGSHMLDVLLWMTDLQAESVASFCDNRGTPVDIDSTMSVRFKGGAVGSIVIAGDAASWHEDITVWCERGSFFIRGGKLTIVDGAGNRFLCEHLTGASNPDRNFIEAILGRGTVAAPFECGLNVMELTEAAYRSSAQGGAVVST